MRSYFHPMTLLLLATMWAGCGVAVPDVPMDDVKVVVDPDVNMTVERATLSLRVYRAIYEERWGRVDMKGWTIHVVSKADAPIINGTMRTGATYWSSREVIIGWPVMQWFPHELHHVQLGAPSIDHAGWCADYVPWEKSTLGADESKYLGCTQ